MKKLFLILAFVTSISGCVSNSNNTVNNTISSNDLSVLIEKAEQGDMVAQYKLGVLYGKGLGVKQNVTKSIDLIRASAQQGYAPAKQLLTQLSGSNDNEIQNEVAQLKQQMQQGNAKASKQLAVMYIMGTGVSQNKNKGLQILTQLATKGDVDAQSMLGGFYLGTHGIKKDIRTAVKWLQKAVKQGDAQSQYNLGLLYGRGEGVRQNLNFFVELLRLSASQGVAQARQTLEQVANQGYKPAIDALKRINSN